MGQSFKELKVWQKAMELALTVYKLSSTFPDAERFGLTNQLRRASVSVPSNIAEGYGRASTGEYRHFLGIARGSNCEIETQMALAKALCFGSEQTYVEAESLCDEVGRLLTSTMRSLKT